MAQILETLSKVKTQPKTSQNNEISHPKAKKQDKTNRLKKTVQ